MGKLLQHIRLATEKEIESLRDKADLMPGHTSILALDNEKAAADLAVVRNCYELNPIVYADATNDARRVRLLWGLEERFLGAGIDRYYFMIDAANEQYQKTVEHWGAERVSPHPEIRYLKVIK